MKGRGGAGFCASATASDATGLLVVGGFIGEETNDVYRFDFKTSACERSNIPSMTRMPCLHVCR